MFSSRRLVGSLARPLSGFVLGSPMPLPSVSVPASILTRSFATKPQRRSKSPSSGRSSSSKGTTRRRASRSGSSSKKAKSAKGASRKRTSVASKAKEQEKKERALERKAAERENKLAREEEQKARRAIRKAERRERKQQKHAEEVERRRERRHLKAQRNAEKRELEKEKERVRRAKEKARAFGRKREPGSPPMPKNAMAIFVSEQFPKAQGSNQVEKMKWITGQWRSLPEEEKKRLGELVAKDKERYKAAFAAWRKDNPPKPKRGLTDYIIFANEKRAELLEKHPELKGKPGGIAEAGKLLGAQWKSLSEAEKAPYKKRSQESRANYQVELAKWEAKMGV